MAVEIVDPTPNPRIVREKSCYNCGVRLRYVPNDIKRGVDTDYAGGRDPYYYIDCPNCNKQVRVRGH